MLAKILKWIAIARTVTWLGQMAVRAIAWLRDQRNRSSKSSNAT